MKHRTVLLVDDLNGKKAAETIRFGLDKTLYEIDLDRRNADKLRRALAAYITAGRYKGKARQ